jgi:hypothetical protein
MLESDEARELRRLWDELRHSPFPAPGTDEPELQELALYESWLGSIVESALSQGGRLSPAHQRLLEVRREEGNRPLWEAAARIGENGRAYVARLFAIEDLLGRLPRQH